MIVFTKTPTGLVNKANPLNLPSDVARPLKVIVEDTSDPLRRFLADMLNKLNNLETTVISLEKRIKALE